MEAEFSNTKVHNTPFDAFYVFDSHALLFEPGTQFAYSSNGYILLSGVIEKLGGKPFVDVLDDKLWRELGLKHTELDKGTAQQEVSYYQSHTNDDDYEPAVTKRDRSFLFGGGGLLSTPSDLVKMAQATYDKTYLSSQGRKALQTPTRLRDGRINEQNYGLGWRVGQTRLKATGEIALTLAHSGVMLGAATAYLFVIPQCQASIAFATNTVPQKYWRMHSAMQKILKRFIDAKQCA